MYFKSIRKTKYYKENHEKYVPWSKVIEVILTTKNKRKKGDKIEIEDDRFYILCELKDKILYVINVKRK